jgi:uncharacterized protein YkwD
MLRRPVRSSALAALAVGTIALVTGCLPFNSQEEYLFNKTNELRRSEHVHAMGGMDELTQRARDWARTLADRQALAHSDLRTIEPAWTAVGENIGRSDTIEHVYVLLERSPEHRANMVDPTYTRTGVGTARGRDGMVYAVQLFWAG